MKSLSNFRVTKAVDASGRRDGFYLRATDESGADVPVAITRNGDQKRNAELIARVCNAHDDMARAIDHVLEASEDNGHMCDIDFDLLRAALAKSDFHH